MTKVISKGRIPGMREQHKDTTQRGPLTSWSNLHMQEKRISKSGEKHWKGVDVINPGAPRGLGRVCVQTRKGRKPTKYIKHWVESSEEY